VIEAGFVSPDGYTVELHGTEASLTFRDGVLRVAGEERPVPPDAEDAFTRWIDAIGGGAPLTDNLDRAVELTRLVVAANAAAASGRAQAYP
jgi:hypothetical protein